MSSPPCTYLPVSVSDPGSIRSVDPDLDPYLESNPDLDPGGQKLPAEVEKVF